jgi:hypothetical protein
MLPEDAPPLKVAPGSSSSIDPSSALNQAAKPRRDLLSILLLLCVTLTYLIRFPGIPVPAVIHWLNSVSPTAASDWIVAGGRAILLIGTGFTACYAALRPDPLRIPLVVAAGLVLILWLLAPILHTAVLSG